MSKKSEDVLLMVKHVRHKKVDGTLYVNSGRIAWRNQTSDSFRISAAFEDIRLQRVSLDNKEKVQLQLLMHSGESFTFHFADTAGREKQLEMRNKVKEMLQLMLPKFKDKAHSELNEKFRILESNPHLLSLYKELVVTGILSSEEFWARPEFSQSKSVGSTALSSAGTKDGTVPSQWVSRSGISLNLTQERTQIAGVPSCLLSDIKPEMDGTNSIKYNLTKEIIDAIFRAYPAVRQRHRDLVPDKLSEADFWNKFFQSHYYHRDRGIINQDDVFSECDGLDEKILRQELLRCRKMRLASHLDVGDLEDHSIGEGYGVEPPSPPPISTSNTKQKVNTNQLLLHRFNKHSILIMRALAKYSAGAASTAATNESAYRDLAASGNLKRCFYESDSCKDSKIPKSELELAITKDYFQSPSSVMQSVASSLTQSQARQALAACRASLAVPNRGGRLLFNNSDVQLAIADVSAGGCLMAGGKSATGEKSGAPSSVLLLLSSEQSKELSMLYSAAGELLRHFWVCLPTTTVAMAEKIIRIYESLGRFEATKLTPFIESVESTLSNAGVRGNGGNGNGIYRCRVTAHLESLINAAKDKFNEWHAGQKRLNSSQ
ncbi:General transcription factor IIH subunit 1 [Echinococcus granulosus]|uniref:General transcription factor iih subunit 1 n=1 Tax=Echinococcus granulosus TaxID=6210 RepID=A0A068WN68_ECHGR|nr:General transcription factor IIH subunit 1 [Echinococcus granulosus]CDS19119.1 general transcription factor iih subunit 1 [Echinococcus granulosus]